MLNVQKQETLKILQVKRVEMKVGQEGSDFKTCRKLSLIEIGVTLHVGDKEWKRKETRSIRRIRIRTERMRKQIYILSFSPFVNFLSVL